MTRHKKYKWEIVTKIEKKERGMIVMLDSLNEELSKSQSVTKLKSASLTSDEGLEPLLEKLDLVFKSRKNNDTYDIYSRFMTFKREGEMSISDYLLEYKHLYNEVTKLDIHLPETVLVFRLLEGANLEEDERKLALALGNDLKLKTMKFVLKRIFGKIKCEGKKEKEIESIAYRSLSTSVSVKKSEGIYFESLSGECDFEHGTRCKICKSVLHLENTCQHAKSDIDERVKESKDKVTEGYCKDTTVNENMTLIEEANTAVLNTICKETIAGERWFENYKKRLSPLHQKKVETYPSTGVLRFTNGSKLRPVKTAVFPVKIANMVCKLEAEIVEDDIPLLLGKASLTKASTVIDLQHGKIKMFGKDVEMNISSCGNICINILPEENEFLCQQGNILLDEEQSPFLQKEKMIELHIQFGHATAENLKKIARNAGVLNSNLNRIIDDVVEECNTCAIVGMTKSDEFNQRIFVGFHEIENNVWFMHIVDEYTRFSNAAIINNKRATVRTFLKSWHSLFGAPREIFCDNRNEFIGEDFFDMCKSFSIKVSKTPSGSPWSNGVCERHNKTLTSILLEIKEDNKCSWENALVWAISAKNAVINHSGLSPAQIVFGRTGKSSNSLIEKMTGLESANCGGRNISGVPSARKTRDANRLSRLRERRARQTKSKQFTITEKNEAGMHYQREMTQQWKNPSRVLVPVLLLRKGAEYVKAQVCRVNSFGEEDGEKEEEDEEHSDESTHETTSEGESGISSGDLSVECVEDEILQHLETIDN